MILNGPQLGLIIVAFFGALWAAVGASVLRPWLRVAVIAFAIAIAAFLIIQSPRMHQVTAGYFNLRIYMYSVLFEVIAIALAIVLIRRFADRSFILPAISIIVGLHFVGMRLATGQDVFVWLAVAMCVAGTVAALSSKELRSPIAGFGSALALWTSAITMIVK